MKSRLVNLYKFLIYIIINWITSLGLLPIPKSDSIEHINENLDALKFEMSQEDISLLNSFRVPAFEFPQVAYGKDGVGVKVDQLPNVFDGLYDSRKG